MRQPIECLSNLLQNCQTKKKSIESDSYRMLKIVKAAGFLLISGNVLMLALAGIYLQSVSNR
ncbi:MAG: hypothetical protein A2X08_09295 [Bacteroidetes bacterium GWA2_32_17]|nr:MAG: hypothetical protein A2X08_09295 [Bacteroidetes bacterium GWA2_32_17]